MLSQAEQRYSNIEREALATVFEVIESKQFLLGKKFKFESDHRPLEFVFPPKKELPKIVSARITRWAVSLKAFEYETKHKKGSSIPHADAMSRLKFDRDDASAIWSVSHVQILKNSVLTLRSINSTHSKS